MTISDNQMIHLYALLFNAPYDVPYGKGLLIDEQLQHDIRFPLQITAVIQSKYFACHKIPCNGKL